MAKRFYFTPLMYSQMFSVILALVSFSCLAASIYLWVYGAKKFTKTSLTSYLGIVFIVAVFASILLFKSDLIARVQSLFIDGQSAYGQYLNDSEYGRKSTMETQFMFRPYHQEDVWKSNLIEILLCVIFIALPFICVRLISKAISVIKVREKQNELSYE